MKPLGKIFYLIVFGVLVLTAISLLMVHEGRADTLEARKQVAVIDTGIDLDEPRLLSYLCKDPGHDFTGTGLRDTHGHGTNIAWTIMNGLDPHRFCLMVLKYYLPGDYNNLSHEIQAFEWATAHHAVLINFSGGGPNGPIFDEAQAVFAALQAGIIVVVAAGNEGKDIGQPKQGYYPACAVKHQNFHVVGSGISADRRLRYSNYGAPVTDWAVGENIKSPNGREFSGTSQATALVSHRLLMEVQ